MFDAKLAMRTRPVRDRDQLPEGLADEALGAGHTRALGVRRVAEHQVDAAVPHRGELADVGLEAVDGRVVELPVARVEDAPGGRLDDDRDAVGDRVGHPHELELERADLHAVAVGVGLAQRRRGAEAVLVELRLHHRERQLGPDHLCRLDLAEDVRQRADVILVAVREHDREQRPVLEVREVRQDEVDAEVLVPRERESRVDQDALPVELVEGHVLADLAEPAERDDAERVAHGSGLWCGWIIVAAVYGWAAAAGPAAATAAYAAAGMQQAEPFEAAADGRFLFGASRRRAAGGSRRRRDRAG